MELKQIKHLKGSTIKVMYREININEWTITLFKELEAEKN